MFHISKVLFKQHQHNHLGVCYLPRHKACHSFIIIKTLVLIFVTLAFNQISNGQQNEWRPIPIGDSLPTEIFKDPAIWEKVNKPESPLFKSSLIYQDRKPFFYNKIKPEILPKAKFIQVPIKVKEQFKCDGNLLFKDNSTTKIKYLDKAHGFFSDEVYGLAEDKKGNIYFGSEEKGLGKFNGDVIQVLEGDSTYPILEVMALTNDSKERLWVGTKNMVCFIKDEKLHIFKIKESIYVRSIEEDYKGNIWVNTIEEGSYCIGETSVLHYKKGLPNNEVGTVAVEKNGRIWLASRANSICFIRNDSLFGIPLKKGSTVTRFYQDSNRLWACSFAGDFLQIRNDSLFKFKFEKREGNRNMYSCFRNSKGFWFSVYGGGIYLLDDNGMVRRFSEKNGISNNHIFSMIPDQFGNIWAGGLFYGISRIEEVIFQTFDNQAILGRCSEIEEFNGDVWYFMNGGKTTKTEGDFYWYISNAGTKDIPRNMHLTDGVVVGPNEAWLANYGSGFTHLKGKEFTFYKNTGAPIYDQSIFNIQIDSQGHVFGTSHSNKLLVLRDNQIYDLSTAFFFKDLEFQKTYNGSELIYILCKKEVLLLKNGLYKFIDSNTISENGKIQAIKEMGPYVFLFGENGIQKLNSNGDLIQFYKTDQFQGKTLKSVEVIDSKSFIIATDKGILIIKLFDDHLATTLYGSEYGLSLLNFDYIKKLNDNILISGSSELYEYLPQFKKQAKTPPKLNLINFRINDQLMELDKFTFASQQDIMTFSLSSISWGLPHGLEYQLIKNDNKNSPWQTNNSNQIRIGELTFGTYKLLVKSINKDGESKILTIPFTVKKDIHQTLWFKLIIIFSLLSLIALYVFLRNKKSVETQKRLELQVEKKTMELSIEKEELRKQLEHNNLLLKEVHHRVKNNMQLVSSLLELQSEFAKDDFAKNALKKGNDRIKALALAHQNLYQNEDYENIELNDYFYQIINYLLSETDCKVDLNIPINFLINIERGQVLGFIVNELIVNSIKHAWPPKTSGRLISISITTNNNRIYFAYTDNGIGFPNGFSFEKTNSLGYTLIPSFVKRQLKGSFNCKTKNGAHVNLDFPV